MSSLPHPAATLLSRRGFLKAGVAVGGTLALGPGFWDRAYAQQPTPGPGPYGPLQAADANGLMLPEGFSSRIVARGMQPVGTTGHVWHAFPDGGHCFPADDGGWVYCSNSENPPPSDRDIINDPNVGGVGAIRFDADGDVVGAYTVLSGTRSNCAGGPTPWGTWLSCEEFDLTSRRTPFGPATAGRVYEVDPMLPESEQTPLVHGAMGVFKHEMATIDPVRRQVYLSEDMEFEEGHERKTGGRFYRFTPTAWPDLSAGVLEAAVLAADGRVTWAPIPDPAAATVPTRMQAPASTVFDGGEGCFYDDGHVYLTTKGDDRVWDLDVAAQRMRVLYDAADYEDPVLTGVDNIIVSSFTSDLVVAEDQGNMEVVVITPQGVVAPIVRATGPQHGFGNPAGSEPFVGLFPEEIPLGDVPTMSEITGLAFSPDGSRLYLNSQRGGNAQGPGPGITYEVTGPFVAPRSRPTEDPRPSPPSQPPDLPATGGGAALGLGAAAVALGLRLRGGPRD